MNVKEMLQKALREMGADGLCNPLDEHRAAKWIAVAKEVFPDGYFKVI